MKRILLLFLVILPVALSAASYPGEKSLWQDCDRYDFQVEGRHAIVVVPKVAAEGRPWIWRPAFFGAFPSVDAALLEKGWHIAYYDVTHLYGSPRAVSLSEKFFDYVCENFSLPGKAVVEGFSRGGYFSFAWAAAHPEKVSAIYVDAPVCDVESWPGRKSEGMWKAFLEEWGIEDSQVDSTFCGNALQHLGPIAAAHIPIIAVCGGKDSAVPYEDNMLKVRRAFQKMGGVVETIVKPDCDHHPHSLEDPEPVVDFLMRYADGYSSYQEISLRGSLRNSMTAMAVEKKATVAFFGGSITQMEGWKDMAREDLQQRFPDTEFTFIDAGIASLGSTPHAFRFENDVLSKGVPDLLFLEAAVNDHTNGFGPRSQVLGMEGIVRHALKANPNMDIVILDFIYDPFIPMMEKGIIPDVVLNHERVANHYGLNSANMVGEIFARMADGQFTWKEFGGTHPARLGHKYYNAAISAILDANTLPFEEYTKSPRTLDEPLEMSNYENGMLVPVSAASRLKGFAIDDCWKPSLKGNTRPGFVEVPALTSDNGGSFVFEFDGRAVGIYCMCGPDSGIIEYTIDSSEPKRLDTYTQWSRHLYIPWVYVFADGLNDGHHVLKVKMAKSGRMGCHIKNFVVNR